MQIHDLKPKRPNKKKTPRVGRGGKRGTFSGRGSKGQRARAGHKIRPAIRDLLQRLPKLRGYANNPKSDPTQVLSLTDLNRLTDTKVNFRTLTDAKIIKRSQREVKILGNGEVTKALTIEGLKVSKSAKAKIEAAGGKVVE